MKLSYRTNESTHNSHNPDYKSNSVYTEFSHIGLTLTGLQFVAYLAIYIANKSVQLTDSANKPIKLNKSNIGDAVKIVIRYNVFAGIGRNKKLKTANATHVANAVTLTNTLTEYETVSVPKTETPKTETTKTETTKTETPKTNA